MNERETEAGLAETPGYRYVEQAGDRLYVAGQVPLDADGQLVGAGDPTAQAGQCLTNLTVLLGLHGFGPEDLRHLTVYVVGEHQNLLDAWDAVRNRFDGNVPPATLLGVNLLGHSNQLVEMDATTVRRSGSATPSAVE